MINAQIPIPSFEDIRKILQFWIDQQDKWFYFENDLILSNSYGEADIPPPMYMKTVERSSRTQKNYYIQSRIVGKIHDVISYPPSLMLSNAKVFLVKIDYERNSFSITSKVERDRFGLVFSQITYYEPIDDIGSFLEDDDRINT